MQFSVLWASAVSYIVYKSLQDTILKIMNPFKFTLGIAILLSIVITILEIFSLDYFLIPQAYLSIGPLSSSFYISFH